MSLRLSNYRQMKFLPWLTATERKRETGAKCVEFTPPGAAKPASSKQINFWHVKTIQIYIWLRTQSSKPNVTWWRSIVLLQEVYFKLIQGNPNYHFRCSSNPHIHSYSLAVSTPLLFLIGLRWGAPQYCVLAVGSAGWILFEIWIWWNISPHYCWLPARRVIAGNQRLLSAVITAVAARTGDQTSGASRNTSVISWVFPTWSLNQQTILTHYRW